MSSEIRDINLAKSGEQKIEWVKRNCDLLRTLEAEFEKTKQAKKLHYLFIWKQKQHIFARF